MQCPKCGGKMRAHRTWEYVRAHDAALCTLCGEMIDPVILANRAQQAMHNSKDLLVVLESAETQAVLDTTNKLDLRLPAKPELTRREKLEKAGFHLIDRSA